MNLFNIYLFTVILVLGINNVLTLLTTNEYDCLVNLATKTNVISTISQANGIYDFCKNNPSFNVTCSGNSTSKIDMKSQSITVTIPALDFSCFDKLKILFLENTNIPNDFLSSSDLPPLIDSVQIKTDSIYGIPFAKPFRNITNIKVYTDKQPLVTIPFSSFLKTSAFEIYPSAGVTPTSTSHLIHFNNDLTGGQVWNTGFYNVISMNFPAFNNVDNGYIYINLLPSFDKNSFYNNITSISNLYLISITSKESNVNFPSLISTVMSSSLKVVTFNMMFLAPILIIDISHLNSISTLTVRTVGRSFSFNGNLPFILPNSLTSFEFSDGTITTFNFYDYNITKLNFLTLSNNTMTGTLPPVWDKSSPTKNVILHYNNLYGTIDRSYCVMDLKVKYNNFSGSIPSCFTCFFGLFPTLKDAFSNNQFTNFDNPPPCTTIIPNIILSKSVGSTHEFHLFGEDLGPKGIEITNIGLTFTWTLITWNTLFRGVYVGSLVNASRIIELKYPSPLPSFFVSWNPLPPQISNVTWIGNDLVFSGSYYSYNSSIIDIDVGGFSKCNVTSTTFFQINCQVSGVPTSETDIITYVKVGNLTSQITLVQGEANYPANCSGSLNDCNNNGYCNTRFHKCYCNANYQGLDCSKPYKECPIFNGQLCNGAAGSCYNQTGICTCTSSFQGFDCSLDFKQCPIFENQVCNGASGSCNNQTGECTCLPSFTGLDCSSCASSLQGVNCDIPYIECSDPLCGGNGKCNNITGICDCVQNYHGYTGVNCSIPLHSVSSVDPSSVYGGQCSIFGWFGDIHDNPSVLIGTENCPILSINESTIICDSPPGEGLKSITVKQNSFTVTTPKIYQYYVPIKSCINFNDCTSPKNGKCNTVTGYCECINNWYGPECNLLNGNDDGGGSNNGGELPNSNTTIDTDTGSININNQQINYQISITSLLEIDFSGNTVVNYPLQNIWVTSTNKSKTTVDGNTFYTFVEKIGNKNSTIIYTIEEVPKNKQFSFAGIQFSVDGGSVKMTIAIENYEYSSNLNTLQLQMKSSVNTLTNGVDQNNCNNHDVDVETIENDNSLSFISIQKDAKVLNGRFLNRLISDGKSTFMSTTLISKSNDSIIVGINLPHCLSSCLIDPDFSVLINTNFIANCNGSSKKPWLIPVAVVVPIVSVCAIGAIAVFVYRKNKVDPVILKLREMNKQNQNYK